jgi:hypothetical protein
MKALLRIRRRLLVAGILGTGAVVLVTGCFQELDSGAASGGPIEIGADGSASSSGEDATAPNDAGAASSAPASEDANGLTTWELCQSPSCDLPSGQVPYLDQTPPIYLPDASTTDDPCVDVEQASIAIRTTYCAACHQTPADQAGINFVLDDGQLVTATSQSATDDAGQPEKLVTPGDPAHSWLYVRVTEGLGGGQAGMPPPTMPGYPTIPRPTVADISVLNAWITACVPGADAGGYALSGGGYAPLEDGGEVSTPPVTDAGGAGAPDAAHD